MRQHIPLLASSCQTAWLHILQDCNLNISCCEYLRLFSVLNVFISFCFVSVNYGQIPQASSTKPICGIVGTLRLLAGPYLVIITKKHKVGSINGQTIWQVAETEVISYSRTLLHLTEKQVICCRFCSGLWNSLVTLVFINIYNSAVLCAAQFMHLICCFYSSLDISLSCGLSRNHLSATVSGFLKLFSSLCSCALPAFCMISFWPLGPISISHPTQIWLWCEIVGLYLIYFPLNNQIVCPELGSVLHSLLRGYLFSLLSALSPCPSCPFPSILLYIQLCNLCSLVKKFVLLGNVFSGISFLWTSFTKAWIVLEWKSVELLHSKCLSEMKRRWYRMSFKMLLMVLLPKYAKLMARNL